MSNLDNLTSKIISDAEVKKEEMLRDASEKATLLRKKKVEEANKKASSILEKAKQESKSIRERVISKADLEVRNNKLGAKQEVVSKVFELAKEKLKAMNNTEFENFVKTAILNIEVQGDEKMLMNDTDKAKLSEDFLGNLNKELEAKGKLGKITFSDDNSSIEGGFILTKNGIEINYSFEELVGSLRYELEYEVGSILFSE